MEPLGFKCESVATLGLNCFCAGLSDGCADILAQLFGSSFEKMFDYSDAVCREALDRHNVVRKITLQQLGVW